MCSPNWGVAGGWHALRYSEGRAEAPQNSCLAAGADVLVDECIARLIDDAEVQGQAVSERGPIQAPLTRLALRATLSRKGRGICCADVRSSGVRIDAALESALSFVESHRGLQCCKRWLSPLLTYR